MNGTPLPSDCLTHVFSKTCIFVLASDGISFETGYLSVATLCQDQQYKQLAKSSYTYMYIGTTRTLDAELRLD